MTAARPDSTERLPMVTMIGLNPRRAINPLASPTTTPHPRPAASDSQTGWPCVISQPVTHDEKAAVPGSERSRTPVRTPNPTPAAKMAVMAAALATSRALFHVAKYGAHQN